MNYLSYIFFLVLPALLLQHCSHPTETAGATAETTNGISGIIRDTDGKVVDDAEVVLLDHDYDPYPKPTLPKTAAALKKEFTDSRGRFRFDSVAAGLYNIEASHPENSSLLLVRDIEVTEENNPDSVNGVLEEPARLVLSLLTLEVTTDHYIYLPGTRHYAGITDDDLQAGFVTLENIPAASYTDLAFKQKNLFAVDDILDAELVLHPGETETIGPYHSWKHRFKVTVNTTAAGAGISGNLTDCPVLIRLTDDDFDFSSAREDGDDVRFTRSDGMTPLSFELERWNAVSGNAEIWVKMDTVYGNNDSQHIYMYTGQDDAHGQSSGTAVFINAAGFAGVWHLKDLTDAAQLQNIALDYGTRPATGIVGRARAFSGTSDSYLSISHRPEYDMYRDFTLSIWCSPEFQGDSNSAQGIFTNMVVRSIIFRDGSEVWFRFRLYHTTDSATWLDSKGRWSTGSSYHIALTRSNDTFTMYVNGRKDSEISNIGALHQISNPFVVGTWRSDRRFSGVLDEFRVSSAARSADWIRFCYENQKENSTVVKIE